MTARREVQVPRLVTPLTDPNFVPSAQSSEAGLPVIRFPSLFDPTPNPNETMPIQKLSINIGSVLGTLVPEPSETFPLPPLPRFSQGEFVMRKGKRGEEEVAEAKGQQALPLSEPSKAKTPSKKGKNKNGRALQKATGHVSHKHKHRNDSKEPWKCEFYIKGWPVDEEDLVLKSKEVRGGQVVDAVGRALLLPKDMKIWQEKRSEQMLENLKRDSILVSFQTLYFRIYYTQSH